MPAENKRRSISMQRPHYERAKRLVKRLNDDIRERPHEAPRPASGGVWSCSNLIEYLIDEASEKVGVPVVTTWDPPKPRPKKNPEPIEEIASQHFSF